MSSTYICPKPRIVFPQHGLASSAFARHYSRNLVDFFSSAYLDVSLRQVPLINLFDSVNDLCFFNIVVSQFGDPRIDAYLQLPEAYRS